MRPSMGSSPKSSPKGRKCPMEKETLSKYLGSTLRDLSFGTTAKRRILKGKVRDIIDLGDRLVITTTDRLSAFDRVLTTVPCKGQVLNELSLFWFDVVRKIIPNHILKPLT